ncbi:MAG: DUF2946 domain-containing protein [Sneathiella sp.]|nr:DUF2946 domain-containing protein [Sneathiella sp.]
MTVTAWKSREIKEKKFKRFSFRRRSEKLFGFLAMLAVALNFLVPVTHGLVSSAQAGEFLEICTNNGIEIVKVNFASENSDAMDGMDEGCPACPDCPLCQFGKTEILTFLNKENTHPPLIDALRGSFVFPSQALEEDPPWGRPALRAPPLV